LGLVGCLFFGFLGRDRSRDRRPIPQRNSARDFTTVHGFA
jgi:hypothetical protein